MGRSDIFLKLEIIKKTVGLIILLISIRISVMAIAWSLLISTVISMIINSWPNRQLLDYDFFSQMTDILSNLVLAFIMGVLVLLTGTISMHPVIKLIIQILSGMVIYLLLSVITKNESFLYLIGIIKQKRKSNEVQ